MMLSGGGQASALAPDTVFATVMIICNGVPGACLFAGSLRHLVVSFRVEGTTAEEEHPVPPPMGAALASLVLLLMALGC